MLNVLDILMHPGTLLLDMVFEYPTAAIFFNQSPNNLIVACSDDIFIVDVMTQSTKTFSSALQRAFYRPNALALSEDDAVLVAGNTNIPYSVCGYDTATLERMWIHNTENDVGAVCMIGAHLLATVYNSPTLVLDYKTGELVTSLTMAEGSIF